MTREEILQELQKSDRWEANNQPPLEWMVDTIFRSQEEFGIRSVEVKDGQVPPESEKRYDGSDPEGDTLILAIASEKATLDTGLRMQHWADMVCTTADGRHFSNPDAEPERDDDGNVLVWLWWD